VTTFTELSRTFESTLPRTNKNDLLVVESNLDGLNELSLIKWIKQVSSINSIILLAEPSKLHPLKYTDAGYNAVMKKENGITPLLNAYYSIQSGLPRIDIQNSPISRFTDRQAEIFELLGKKSLAEIQKSIGKSQATVSEHKAKVMAALCLDLQNTIGAATIRNLYKSVKAENLQ
jgi:DNA-binding NarL/FixJ family response regulator